MPLIGSIGQPAEFAVPKFWVMSVPGRTPFETGTISGKGYAHSQVLRRLHTSKRWVPLKCDSVMKAATGFHPHQNARDFTEAPTERFETNKAVNPFKVFDGLVIS
ncbi:hypothetical protein [Agrobacterium tumefaciens]|uniref:hypothetical protein n=1 Tax=Agrobacterium tumefaciens TaxID=358 RepID=UPI00114621AD